MARRIVSLKGSQPQFSAAPLSSASPLPITSIHSIVSDRHTMTLGTAATQPREFGANSTSLPGDSNSSTDDTYLRHDTYFFEDGNITFLVCDVLRCCVCLSQQCSRPMAGFIVFIDTSFLATQLTSITNLPVLAYGITNLCTLSYRWTTSNARISKPYSLSYTPGKFVNPLPCRPVLHS